MAEHFNQLTPAELEVIAVLSEECAEVQQEIGKILRHGLDSKNPFDPKSVTNLEKLRIELGDILAALELLERVGLVSRSELETLKERKLKKLPRFLHHVDLE